MVYDQLRILGATQRTTSQLTNANGQVERQMSRSHHPVEKAMALIPVRDARQSYPPVDAVFSPFKHGSIRYGRTASAVDRAVLVEPTNDSVTHCYAFGYPVADTLWITSDIQNERATAAGVGRARYEASPGERRPKVAVRSWCDDADREEVESGCHQRSPVARAHRASPVGRVIPYLDRTVTTEAIPLWPTHGRPVGLSGQRASKPGGRWSGPLKRRAH